MGCMINMFILHFSRENPSRDGSRARKNVDQINFPPSELLQLLEKFLEIEPQLRQMIFTYSRNVWSSNMCGEIKNHGQM
jgi:hypothetical protein